MMRSFLLEKVISRLSQNGFTYQSFWDSNSSFDIIARKQNLVLILKVLSNIDSLRNEHARDLQKLARVFNAHSLIIGEKTKVFELQANVLYERYNLPVLSLQGFESLLEQKMPIQRSFKGKNAVELDTQKLRLERETRALTLKELSEQAGVSLESLHRYEHGFPAQLEVAEKLEKILNTKLIRGINVFDHSYSYDEIKDANVWSNNTLEQLKELGLKLSVFERAPVTAAGEEQPLLISHVENPQNVSKKAIMLEKTQHIVKQPGVIITTAHKKVQTGSIPIIQEEELHSFSSIHDLLEVLHERKKEMKKNTKNSSF